MAAKDIFHQQVVKALEKDGWTITDDPLSVKWMGRTLQVDLGAERIIAAVKGAVQIAVEIKSFISPSPIEDLKEAIGQFFLYLVALEAVNSPRLLYLAIRDDVYADLFALPEGQRLCEKAALKIIVFNADREEIVKWIN